jgi:hypothetical protein
MDDKAHKAHHARQAGPKKRQRETAEKKKKGTLEQSRSNKKNMKVWQQAAGCGTIQWPPARSRACSRRLLAFRSTAGRTR